AFLHVLRGALDQVLGLLEAEAGDRTDFLNHVDLLLAAIHQHDGEFGLRFGSRSSSSATGGGNRDRSRGGNAPSLFELLGKLGSLEHGELRELVHQLLQISHSNLLVSTLTGLNFSASGSAHPG